MQVPSINTTARLHELLEAMQKENDALRRENRSLKNQVNSADEYIEQLEAKLHASENGSD